MKRVQLEPWTTYEKLCLASAVHKTGDQNWTAVSRAVRNIYEDSTKTTGEERRPPEWFSMKQCAAQYESLLKNVVCTRRKKRTEKGSEINESPPEIIINVLRQDHVEELRNVINDIRSEYLKELKEIEEVELGLHDDHLEEMLAEDAKERERDTKLKLKNKISEKLEAENSAENQKLLHESLQENTDTKPSSSTSPLLTSLLQSPSPLTRAPNASPAISLLLNSTASNHSNESPTLSKLLESSSLSAPPALLPTPTPATPITPTKTSFGEPTQKSIEESLQERIRTSTPDLDQGAKESIDSSEVPAITKNTAVRKLDYTLKDAEPEEEILEVVEKIIDEVKMIIETVGPGEANNLNQTLESETMDDQIDSIELDQEAVELIVMGPNQGQPVINVRHDTSGETTQKSDKELSSLADVTSTDEDSKNTVEDVVETAVQEVDNEAPPPDDEPSVVEDLTVDEYKADETENKDNEVSIKEEVIDDTTSVDLDTDEKQIEETTCELKEEVTFEPDSEEDSSAPGPPSTEDGTLPEADNSEDTQTDIPEPTPPSDKKSVEDENQQDSSQSAPEVKPIPEPVVATTTRQTRSMETPPRRISKEDSRPNTPINVNEPKRGSRKRSIAASVQSSDSKPNSPAPSVSDDDKDYKQWKKSITMLFGRIAAHKNSSVFAKPITDTEATGYHSVVLRPMDLATIKRNIESGVIRTTVDFQRDVLLMVYNAIMYNKRDSLVYQMAQEMWAEMLPLMDVMVQALGDGVPSNREETSERLPTRGRASKGPTEDSSTKRKRQSVQEESPRPKRKKD